GVTGLVTYAYFALASHTLSSHDYGQITLLWSTIFIVVSVLYRPVEQMLSRTISDRDVRGQAGHEHLRVAVTIQLTLGLVFLVAVGIFSGQSVVALGMVAAPLLSLSVVPWAVRRSLKSADPAAQDTDSHYVAELDAASAGEPSEEVEFTLSHGSGFAAAVLLIMISEQTFLNAGPLLVKATEGASGAAVAGFVFNALLIARAPLQLFQAIQTSILPSLSRMAVGGEDDPFRRSVRLTLSAVAVFGACVALGFLA